jgi:hypothetical protein
MADNPNEPGLLEQTEQMRSYWGEAFTPETIVAEFPLYGFGKRVEALTQIDRELATMDTGNLRKVSDLDCLRRKMRDMHHALRKVGR